MQNLIEFLREGVVTVDFTKVDGAPRTMNCTTSEEIIPVENIVKESSKKKNDEVAVVWDLDKSAWRSFRLDSVNSFKYNEYAWSKKEDASSIAIANFFKGRAM